MPDSKLPKNDAVARTTSATDTLWKWTNHGLISAVIAGFLVLIVERCTVPKQAEVAKPVPRVELRSVSLEWLDAGAAEVRSDTFHAELTSVWGSDDGRSVSGRACPPEGFTLVSYDQRPSVTLGYRPWAGSVQQDSNCVAYTLTAKHGPWHDRWRHMVSLDLTLVSRKEALPIKEVRQGDSASYATCDQPLTLTPPPADGKMMQGQVNFSLEAMSYLQNDAGKGERSEPVALTLQSGNGLEGVRSATEAPADVRFVAGIGLQIKPQGCAVE